MEEIFYLFLLSCKIARQSGKCKDRIITARGTKNFGLYSFLSGNRHKFTSMFICASPVLPCTGVACFHTKFQVPLTAMKMPSHFAGLSGYCSFSKINSNNFSSRNFLCNHSQVVTNLLHLIT